MAKYEKVEDYTFTMKPSVREKIRRAFIKLGFRSASALVEKAVEEYLERMEGEGDEKPHIHT